MIQVSRELLLLGTQECVQMRYGLREIAAIASYAD
jgi:hypothetical protein